MKKIVQDIVLDFNTVSAFWFVHAKQGDKNSRVIRITLNDNGVAYRPDASMNAKIRVQKPDEKMVINDCTIDENGKVIAELTDQMLAVCGDVVADVYLTDGRGYILSTCSFVICVDSPPDGANAVSENEFLTLMNAVERAEAAARRAENSAGSGSGSVNSETVKQIVDDYLTENPPADGFSPSARVDQTETGATITVVDKSGRTQVNISNGKNGVGIRSISGNDDGSWTITYTDNNTETISNEAYTALKTLIDGKQPLGNYLTTAHNTSPDAHNDIRNLVSGLTSRLNALLDGDDTSLDQLSEIVAYIKSNKSLIEQVTTNKVNVSDIVNNLTTNDQSKTLSASMGVELKKLIDAINVPTALSQLTQDSEHRTVTDAEKAKWNSGTGDGGSVTPGTPGEDGATFTPSVSPDGLLSWTNDKGKPNPPSVNIKGQKGDRGETGAQGIPGTPGEKGDRGERGLQGERGLTGPQGEPGQDGANGAPGENGGYYTPAVTQPDADHMQVAFSASKTGMPEVEPVSVALPKGTGGGTAVSLEKLTFTGAVNAEYDGTKPVNVDITAGGGGTATPEPWVELFNGNVDFSVLAVSATVNLNNSNKYRDYSVFVDIPKSPESASTSSTVSIQINKEQFGYFIFSANRQINATTCELIALKNFHTDTDGFFWRMVNNVAILYQNTPWNYQEQRITNNSVPLGTANIGFTQPYKGTIKLRIMGRGVVDA